MRWGLARYKRIQRHWLENGPPVYITAHQYLLAMSGKPGNGKASGGGARTSNEVGTPEQLFRMFEGAGGLIS